MVTKGYILGFGRIIELHNSILLLQHLIIFVLLHEEMLWLEV